MTTYQRWVEFETLSHEHFVITGPSFQTIMDTAHKEHPYETIQFCGMGVRP